MSKKFPWLKLQKKSGVEPPLEPPIWMGNRSNGEYWHDATPKEKLMKKMIMERAEAESRHRGVDRREFLASSAGMLATLAVINEMGGCKDDGTPGGLTHRDAGGGMDAGVDGGGRPFVPADQPYYVDPVKATCDPSERLSKLGGTVSGEKDFIFDIQTHSFDDGEWRTKNPSYTSFLGILGSPSCTESNHLDCFDQKHYADLMFVKSDTSLAVITSWPATTCTAKRTNGCGLPLSNEGMRKLRDQINKESKSQRVVNQVQIMPNDNLPLQKEIMTMSVEDPNWRAVSWKAYPAWKSDTYKPNGNGPEGYFLTDDIGREFIEHGLSLGIHNFAIHKGLPIPGFDVEHNKPTDVGPIAKMYPKANFIIYHSGISSGCSNGCGTALEQMPFDPNNKSPMGMSMLLKSLWDEGLTSEKGPKAGLNVFAELGSAWSTVMRDAVAAQHFMGKLLKYVGEDNIVWGTDSILGGSPQSQIEAFRMFEITPAYQEMYGYPAITPAIKAKIFGGNSAKNFRIDVKAERCKLDANAIALYKDRRDAEFGGREWTQVPPLAPRTRQEFIQAARIAIKKGHPGIA